jgi:hypothetical protein
MIRNILSALLALVLTGCDNSSRSRSPVLPNNVLEDRPIILKEGQAIVIVPEDNKSVMIGAAVIDGKLSISEIDPKGKSFSITWKDADLWETSVIDSTEEQTTTTIDMDGDGLPDLRAILKDGTATRFQLAEPKWIELQSKQ